MTQDDELLRQLGELAREEPESGPAGLDERWDRLAAGTLSPEEGAELRRLAEGSEEARAAYEAFRPLGGEFQAWVVRAIREQPPRRAGKVVPFRPALRRVATWSAVAAAAAAAVVLLLRPAAPLPAYSLADVSGGSRELRDDVAALPDFAPGDRFQIAVRPDTEVTRGASLVARAFLARDGEVRLVEVQSHADESGAVRVVGVLDRDLPPAEWTLWIVVGRRGRLPDADALRTAAHDARVRQRDWVAVPVILRIDS